jgi:SAM-dependent methyltransferase
MTTLILIPLIELEVMVENKTLIDKFAEKYEDVGIAEKEIIYPIVSNIIGNVNSKKVLDFGCGLGNYSKILKNDGADVIGIDISQKMIDKAGTAFPDIEFIKIDECEMPFPNETFDVVVANIVFLMIESKEKMQYIVDGLYSVTKPDGLLVFSTTHPCFIDRDHIFYRDTFENGFDYFNSGAPIGLFLRGANGKENFMGNNLDFQYPISVYIDVLLKARFTLEHFRELRYPEEMIDKYPEKVDSMSVSPYIVIGGRK